MHTYLDRRAFLEGSAAVVGTGVGSVVRQNRSLEFSVNGGSARPGGTVTISFRLTNRTDREFSKPTDRPTISFECPKPKPKWETTKQNPDGGNALSILRPPGEDDCGTSFVGWTWSSLAPGASVEPSYDLVIPEDEQSGTYSIPASASGGGNEATATAKVTVENPNHTPTATPTTDSGDSTDISYGESVTGTISGEDATDPVTGQHADRVTFDGNAGDRITVSMVSPDMGTKVRLENPNGEDVLLTPLGKLPDTAPGSASGLTTATAQLGSDGRYTIWAQANEADSFGQYSLKLRQNDGAKPSGTVSFTISSDPIRAVTIEASVTDPQNIEYVNAIYRPSFYNWSNTERERYTQPMVHKGDGQYQLQIPLFGRYSGDLRDWRRRDGDVIEVQVEAKWTDGTTSRTEMKEGHAVHQQVLPISTPSTFPYTESTSLLIPGNQRNYAEAIDHKHLITKGVKTRVEKEQLSSHRYRIGLQHENPDNIFLNEIWGNPNSFILVLYQEEELSLDNAKNSVDGNSYALEGALAAVDYATLPFSSPPTSVTDGVREIGEEILLDEAVDITEHMNFTPETEDVGAYRAIHVDFQGSDPLMTDTVTSFDKYQLDLEFTVETPEATPSVLIYPALSGQHVNFGYTNHLVEYRRQITVQLST